MAPRVARAAPPKSAPRPSARAAASAPAGDPDPFDTSRPAANAAPAQPDLALTTAPAGGEVDEVRQSLSVITTHLAKFDEARALVPELEAKYTKVVYDVATEQGLADAKAARKAIKDPRVALEHARTGAKAPLLKLGRDIDEQARQLRVRLEAIENPIDQQIVAQETKEAERKADLMRRVQELQQTPMQCLGKNAAQLQEVLDAITSMPMEEFAEFRPQAAAAQESARQQVTLLLQNAKLAEEAAALKRQQEEAEARRAELQARVDAIGDYLQQPYKTSARVQQAIERLTATAIGDEFAEFAPAAREKKVAVLQQLVDLRDAKKRAEDAAAEAEAAQRRAEQEKLAHPNGAPMFGVAVKDNGDHVMLDDQGRRSVFCDVDEGDAPAPVQRERHPGDGLPAGAARIYPDEPLRVQTAAPSAAPMRTLSDHDRINDEAAQRLHEAFGRPASGALAPIDGDIVDAEIRRRPSDTELIALVAEHYDVPETVAQGWLATFGRVTEEA